MGISGLLPQLRSITRRAHVSQYRGQKVAVDAYCLLHRGAYTCARELVEGEPTERHVAYCMARIDLLLSAGVTPLIVFDGGRLPNKADEERSRQRNRGENRERARALWAAGNKAAAMECYQKAVDITPAHAKQFVEALKRRGVTFIVAPYEADAQMAYLALNGSVDAVLTEDSDLLCYGCPKVFFKMDKNGEGEEVRLADLPQAKEMAFAGFGHELFQEMCVLAGCDFADSLPGIGVKKAHQHLRRTRCFLKVVRALRFDGTRIPEGYECRVQRALWTFKHQRVYCPQRRSVVHLHDIKGGSLAAGARVPAAAELVDGEPDFLGPALPDDVAHAIAVGDLDPISKQPFTDDLQPCTAPLAADPAASGCSAAGTIGQQPHPGGRRLQQHARSGRGKSGKQQQRQSGAANGGNTLLKFGFVPGLVKASQGGFRPPRPSSAPGSQDSGGSSGGAAAPAAVGEHEQQAQQQQQQGVPGRIVRVQQEGQQEPGSPLPSKPAGDDTLASPADEQWEASRQRLHDMGGRRQLAAACVPGKPATSSHFAARPSVPGMRRPGAAPSGGSLLARLRAALQPEEPTIEELLGRGAQLAQQEPRLSAGLPDNSDAEEEEQEEEEEPCTGQRLLAGRRAQFVVPTKQQQQQRQLTALSLGPPPSPTIDDLLGGGGGLQAAQQRQDQQGEVEDQFPSLSCSPVASQRPSQRLWVLQRNAGSAANQQRHEQSPLELTSPAGLAFLGEAQQEQQQEQQQQHVTPGFYDCVSGSEAGTGNRRLTTLQRRLPAPTPGSSSPQQRLPARLASGGAASALHPCFDAAAAAEEVGAPAGQAGCSPLPEEDPIASLRHIPAFQREAEAAVDRAARVALVAASQAALRPLPPPRHLQVGAPAAVLAAGKRALLGMGEKENGQSRWAVGSKRPKIGGTGSSDPGLSNPFAGFMCADA